jgi:hypothetical protein
MWKESQCIGYLTPLTPRYTTSPTQSSQAATLLCLATTAVLKEQIHARNEGAYRTPLLRAGLKRSNPTKQLHTTRDDLSVLIRLASCKLKKITGVDPSVPNRASFMAFSMQAVTAREHGVKTTGTEKVTSTGMTMISRARLR